MRAFNITDKERQKINNLAQQGIPDTEIAKKLKLSYFKVQRQTTIYWKEKMESKKLTNEKVD